MPTVIPLIQGSIGTPPTSHDGRSGEVVLRYKVTGLAQGQDARLVTGIPQVGATQTIDGFNYVFDRSDAEPVFDGEANVTTYFSTDGRFRWPDRTPPPGPATKEWHVTFQREQISAPFMVREAQYYSDGSALPALKLVWVNKPIAIDIDYAILTRTVYIYGLTDVQMRSIAGQVLYPVGDLHRFTMATPSGNFEWWQYLAPTFIMRQEPAIAGGGSIEITYTWRADPGNGPVGINSPEQNAPGATRATRSRPSFYRYQVSFIDETSPPRVFVVDDYPALDYDEGGNSFPNLYLNPNGWTTLPGNPLA